MARIEKSIEVKVPLRTAYNQWTQFEEFPQFMQSVQEVKQVDDTHLHWRAEFGGKPLEWDAEIYEQEPDKRIAWRGVGGVKNSGEVSFQPLADDRTQIKFALDMATAKNIKDDELASRTEADLKRFKQFIESRGHETGAWRGEVHEGAQQGQPGGQVKQMPQLVQSGMQSAAQAGSEMSKEMGRTMNETSEAMQRISSETAERLAEQTRRATEEWQETASAAASAALRPFNSMLALGSRPWFSTFISAFEEPLSAMRRFSEELDREFESAMRRTIRATGGEAAASSLAWAPSVDIEERDGKLFVHADLPGIRKEDVHVEVQENRLVITGERRSEIQSKNGGVLRTECSYGRFQRAIPLPEEVDVEGAQASMNDGVLEITLPTTHRSRRRRIEIGAQQGGQQQSAQSGQQGSQRGQQPGAGQSPQRAH